jgi:hypothetical protein
MLNNIYRIAVRTSLLFPFLYDKFWAFYYKKSMKYCGRNVYLRPTNSDFKGLWNLRV